MDLRTGEPKPADPPPRADARPPANPPLGGMYLCENGHMSENTKLSAGDTAPSFTIATLSGEITLKALLKEAAKGVIVYFYPKAGTPGCTKEACDFRDNLNSLKSAGYTVIGISPDSLKSLQKFTDKQDLNFLLGSDPDHQVMEEWGTWGTKKNYGRTFLGVIRSTFVVGKDGKIDLAQYNVKATGHVARLRRELGIDAPGADAPQVGA